MDVKKSFSGIFFSNKYLYLNINWVLKNNLVIFITSILKNELTLRL